MFRKFFNNRRMSRGVEIEDSIMTVTQKEEAIIEMPFERRGLSIIWYVIVTVILLLTARVFYLDFFRGDYYREVSLGNRIRSIVTKAPRGLILDKHGNVLARNIPSIDAIIIPMDLPESREEKKNIAEKLSGMIEMNSGNIEMIMDNLDPKSLSPVLLKENISQEQALIIAEKKREFPGIELEKTAIRSYENGAIFSQVIGYDGKITREELEKNPGYLMTDYIGKAGIEKKYEKEIRGKHGARQVEVDSLGEVKRMIGVVNPTPGNDLILNIDEGLQKNIYDKILEMLEKTGADSGAAVAIDPRNGGVLSMVSVPSYDNNMFARGITNDEYRDLITDKSLPLFNRCSSGEYPPGSTTKPAVAAAALSEKTITPTTVIDGMGGALHIGSYRFGDWKVHGPSAVRQAIAESNDIFFYSIGGGYGSIEGLGMTRMKKYYNLFGLGSPTGIDLPMEAKGLIPDEDWKLEEIGERWYVGNSYHASIGQGYVRATPLQLANFTAAIANGGTLYSPRIVNRIKNSDGTEQILSPEILNRNFVSPEIMKILQEGMRMVVTDGTAQVLKTLPVPVAGKTGTAEFGTEKGNTHSWFIAYAPYENPVIALAVIVPGGGEGNSAAVPVAQEALRWYFSEEKE
jgi:penicillin-binding protein 2